MRHARPWRSYLFRHLLAVLEGLLWIAGGALLLAGLLSAVGLLPAMVMRMLVTLLWCAGAFAAGRRSGLHGRRHGLRTGCLCGALLSLVLLCGMCLLGERLSPGIVLRCGLLHASGAAGGVIGVNTKLRKPPD